MKIKICGITRASDAKLAAKLGAWAVGLVFAAHSPRRLTLERASELRQAIPDGVLAVGVFEGNSPEQILAASRACRLGAVQIHGGGPVPEGAPPLIRALAAGETPVETNALALMFEPPRTDEERRLRLPPSAEEQEHAWLAAARFAIRPPAARPMILVAGGLTLDNVELALRIARPDGVDVSSGVESGPGVKDPELLERFVSKVRRAVEDA